MANGVQTKPAPAQGKPTLGAADICARLDEQTSILATISDQLAGLAEALAKLPVQAGVQAPAASGAPVVEGRGGIVGDTFVPVKLSYEDKAGKLYWRAFAAPGMMFGTHGLRVWNEVMEAAGFDPHAREVYELSGWKARFVMKPGDNPGDPPKYNKVVELIPPPGGGESEATDLYGLPAEGEELPF